MCRALRVATVFRVTSGFQWSHECRHEQDQDA